MPAPDDFLAPDEFADVLNTPEFAAMPAHERAAVFDAGQRDAEQWLVANGLEDEASKAALNESFQALAVRHRPAQVDINTSQQGVLGTTFNAMAAGIGPELVGGAIGGAAKLADAGLEMVGLSDPNQRSMLDSVAGFADSLREEGRLVYRTNPANPTAATIGSGAGQAVGMLGTAGIGALANVPRAFVTVPATLGFGLGADQGIDTAQEMGITSGAGKLGMGTAFGAIEGATEMIGGIGGRFLPSPKGLLGAAVNIATESGEEVLSGTAQDALTTAAGQAVEDPNRPGFTETGYKLPGLDADFANRRLQEAIGGAAGGTVFSLMQAAVNRARPAGVGQPMSEATAAGAAMAEDTGDLTAADVADLEPQPTPPPAAAPLRQPILQNVPDRMGRMRETSLNEEPVMEGDVITDLRIPRSPEAIAESQRIENDRLVQEAKLRAQDAKARGMVMIADNPNGSRDILDWANENPIYLPPGFSADRKLPEYEALGRNPLPSYWRQFVASGKQGGNPDTIAQRAYDAGLIAEPTADAYVNALQEGIAGRQQYRVQFAERDKALVQEEKRVVDFEKTQGKLAKKPAAQEVTFEDVVPGDRMTIDGEPAVVRNVEYNEDGYLTNVVIEDGKRFGLMQFDPQTRGGLLVDEFKPASTPFASPANQDPTQTITGSNVQTGTEMPVPPPTADAGAGAGGRGFATTSTPLPANTPATAATPKATATSAAGRRTAANQTSGGGTAASAAASTAAAPAASGNLNPQAGRPRAGEAGFVNAEILSDLAASAIQAGQDFATWARAMLARFGEAVRAQLAAIWQQAQAQFQAREVRFGGTVSRMAPAGTRGFVAVPGGENVALSANNAQNAAMASASGAAQTNEPSPGGLSEAEAEIKSMLPTDVRADYQKFDDRAPILWRGETTFPAVRSVKIIGADSSGKSRSIYPSAAVTLANGGVFVKRFRVSDHAQVSETAFRQYDLDYRLTRERKETERAFNKRIIEAAQSDLIDAAVFAWEDQMRQLRPLVDAEYGNELKRQKAAQRREFEIAQQIDDTIRFFRDNTMRPAKAYQNKFGWTYRDGILKDAQGQELGQFANLDAARFWIRDEYFKLSRAEGGTLNPQAGRPRAGEAGFVNAEILSDLAASAIQAGQDFATWARAMLARFGEAVRAQLAAIWQQAQAQFQSREVRFGGRVTRMAPAATRGFVAVPEGQNETSSRFANPDEAANLYDVQKTELMRGESAAWIDANGLEAALAALEANEPPAGLRIDHLPSLGSALITRLSKLAETGTEAQRLQADALLSRAGAAWHGKASQEAGRTLQQRAMANQELVGIAPILAAKQVLTDRADRVVKERFEGGAEGAVEKIITLDVKAGTEASAELTAQLEGEPDAPELGDNPEVTPVNDTRVAELEQQMQELRQQMLRDQTQAENALQETTSTWQKIMGVLKAAGGRRSSLLTGAKGKLADLRKAAMARKAARRAEGRMYANPVGDFADDAIIGASFLAEGLVEFTNWSQALIREIGFRSGQDLRKLYAEASKQYLAALEAEKAAPTRTKGTPKQRQAREKINKAQRTAQNILDSIARRYSDPPIFEEGQRRINAMRELYKERVRTGMPEAEFVKRAMALGANEGTAGILWEASKLEIDAREMMALEKSRAGLAEFLKKDSPALAKMLNALRQKIAPGMSWAQIFMELPAQQKARQREIYRRLMLDERLKALNQAERLQLTNELDKAWQRERRKVFLRELEKVGALGAKAPADRKKVVQGLPKLLRLMNLGVLNAATFRQAMAPEFNLRSMTGADVARLRDTFNAAYTAPPGILRNRLLQKGLMDMQKITGSTKVELLNNGWVASVLSGGQTLFDTATTLATGGLLDTMTSAVGMAFNGRPDVAITAVAEFWRSLPQLLREAGRILGKGELWYLRQFADEAKHGLEGLGIGSALTGERLLSEKQISKKALGLLLAFTGRTMAAFDHLTNNATKAGALPIARALNPNLYQGALTPSDLDKANARAQAKLEMPDGTPTQINRRTREILESGINPDLLKEAELMGDMAAFQNDPTGFYGGVYQMVKSLFATGERGLTNAADAVTNAYARSAMLFMAGSLRAALGAKFIRFAMNWANKQAMLVPGTYLIQKAGLPIFGSQISRTQANYILGRNVVGLTMMASFYAFLRGVLDKDDEEEGWHLTGNLEGLSTDRINALRAAGVEKLTLWYRDSQGRVVRQVNYKNMPFAAMLAALASTSDERKYLPDKHNTRTQAGHLLRAVAIGAMQFKDISAVEGLSELFQKPKPGSTSEVAEDFVERLAKSAARFTTGFIPNALRDVDSWTDSRYFKPDSAAAEWVKGVPFLRRTVNDGRPLLNLLGEQVEISRAPWNRQVKDVATSEAGRVLGGLLSRGLSVPGADGDGVVVVKDGKKVLLTSLGTGPVYAYQKAVTERYREWLGSDEGRALLSMPAAQAAQVIENRAKAIKRMARVQAVGY